MIKVLLVDDEAHATQALATLMGTLAKEPDFREFAVAGICNNGVEAVKAVHDLQPDLLFLDIQMPKLNGFDVLELLGEEAPPVVFVTAFDDYAIAAFERNALDYLLKPVAPARLGKTLYRYLAQRTQSASERKLSSQTQQLVRERQRDSAPLQRILVRDRGDVFVIAASAIVAIEAADDYVVIHTSEQSHIKQQRLGALEQLLDPQQFCRVHRSCLINLDYLEGIETDGRDSRSARLKHNRKVAISRSGYAKLIERL